MTKFARAARSEKGAPKTGGSKRNGVLARQSKWRKNEIPLVTSSYIISDHTFNESIPASAFRSRVV